MTDLSYESSFDTTIVLEDWISPNRYHCKIYFDVETDDADHQNIAFDRIKIMLEGIFANSMLISMNNPLLPSLAKKTKQRMVTIPTEPLDVILASIIYRKLNAICEGKLSIQKVKISSSQADKIWVHYDSELAEVFDRLDNEMYNLIKETPWWDRPDPSCGDWFEYGKKDTKFHKQKASWDKELQWEPVKTTQLEEPKKALWKPQVIDGGKETKH
jgi:hypothetical protein